MSRKNGNGSTARTTEPHTTNGFHAPGGGFIAPPHAWPLPGIANSPDVPIQARKVSPQERQRTFRIATKPLGQWRPPVTITHSPTTLILVSVTAGGKGEVVRRADELVQKLLRYAPLSMPRWLAREAAAHRLNTEADYRRFLPQTLQTEITRTSEPLKPVI